MLDKEVPNIMGVKHPPDSFEHSVASLETIDMHYVREGQGPDLVLLHGWPGFWWEWHRNIPPLSENLTTLAPDMRGFGETTKPDLSDPSLYEFDYSVEDLRQILDHLNVERTHLVGHDFSSFVVHKFARKYPERTGKLVLLNPALPGVEERYLTPEIFPESWYSQFHQLPLADELVGNSRETVRIYVEHYLSHWSFDSELFSDPDELGIYVDNFMKEGNITGGFNWYRANLNLASEVWNPIDLTPTDIKTLVLWSTDDPIIPVEWSDTISDWYTNFEFEVVPNCGHFIMREATDMFNIKVEEFLTE